MDVFISWSGGLSGAVASDLSEWLPKALQSTRPFLSDDIPSGQRWQQEVTRALDRSSFGIVVVTPDNQMNPWLQFEAEALSKSVSESSRVVPLLVNMTISDLLLPLNIFNAIQLDMAGITSLLRSLNSVADEPLPEPAIGSIVQVWWPELERNIQASIEDLESQPAVPRRTERDLLEEVVEIARVLRDRDYIEPSVPVSTRADLLRGQLKAVLPAGSKLRFDLQGSRLWIRTPEPIDEEVAGDAEAMAAKLGSTIAEFVF